MDWTVVILVSICVCILLVLVMPRNEGFHGHGGRGWHRGRGWWGGVYSPGWARYGVYDDPYYSISPDYNTALAQCKARCVDKFRNKNLITETELNNCVSGCENVLG
jgi:hypothetical protein